VTNLLHNSSGETVLLKPQDTPYAIALVPMNSRFLCVDDLKHVAWVIYGRSVSKALELAAALHPSFETNTLLTRISILCHTPPADRLICALICWEEMFQGGKLRHWHIRNLSVYSSRGLVSCQWDMPPASVKVDAARYTVGFKGLCEL
jgi:hypothetical protein